MQKRSTARVPRRHGEPHVIHVGPQRNLRGVDRRGCRLAEACQWLGSGLPRRPGTGGWCLPLRVPK